MEVRYEDLVNDPIEEFERIRTFFRLSEDNGFQAWVSSRIDAGRCRKWQTELGPEELRLIEVEQSSLLGELGYL
jgi:hypothetical protein